MPPRPEIKAAVATGRGMIRYGKLSTVLPHDVVHVQGPLPVAPS